MLNQMVKDAITKIGNKYLFSIPYTPMTNSPIKIYFGRFIITIYYNTIYNKSNIFLKTPCASIHANRNICFIILLSVEVVYANRMVLSVL